MVRKIDLELKSASDYEELSTTTSLETMLLKHSKPRRTDSQGNITFAIVLLVLLAILLSYIFLYGASARRKVSRVSVEPVETASSDVKGTFEEMHRTLKSIEALLLAQKKQMTIDVRLNGQDVREFYANRKILENVLRQLKEEL